jgi:hypothetical protein
MSRGLGEDGEMGNVNRVNADELLRGTGDSTGLNGGNADEFWGAMTDDGISAQERP